jgi:hypothetical protein
MRPQALEATPDCTTIYGLPARFFALAAQKKVVVRLFKGGLAWGYLSAAGFCEDTRVTLMEVDGRAKTLDFKDIKIICYVRDFNLDDPEDPERLGRRSFQTRPRGEGLWLRLGFLDGDSLEGLSGFDLSFMDSLLQEHGLFLTPPDARANAQRVFVPRSALSSLEVLGYITAPSKRAAPKTKSDAGQPRLFAE